MSGMNDTPDTLPRRRRSSRRKPPASTPAPEPAVKAILEQALHPDADLVDGGRAADGASVQDASADAAPAENAKPARKRRAPRRRKGEASKAAPAVQTIEPAIEPAGDSVAAVESVETVETNQADAPAEPVETTGDVETAHWHDVDDQVDPLAIVAMAATEDDAGEPVSGGTEAADDPAEEPPAVSSASPPDGGGHGATPVTHGHGAGHYWVYAVFAVFLLSLAFGAWGVWATFFAGGGAGGGRSAGGQGAERLSQQVSTLRRSDQISREANRDLERTLAERDEEIAGLRADIAFYESFVGATGQRRGLNVHDLQMQLQGGDAWHFVATLTQNLNRGAVSSGRVTLSVEGTRNDRLERLSWSALRKQNNAPGVDYSFKYFQQVEGEVMLPQGFKPLRVAVHVAPAGGSAVEQSFPWPDAIRPHSAAAR